MARKELAVSLREVTGKKVAQLRRTGVLPGNVYGRGLESVSVQVNGDELLKTLRASGANEVIDLKIEGERATRPVVVHHVQRHPLTDGILHTDFYQVSLREKMRADVPLIFTGQSAAVDTYNGVLVTSIEAVHVEALPLDLPAHIEVDISSLRELEAAIHVRDLVLPESVTLLMEEDVVIVKVASPRVSTEEGEVAAAPEAVAVGEETAAEAAAEESEGASS